MPLHCRKVHFPLPFLPLPPPFLPTMLLLRRFSSAVSSAFISDNTASIPKSLVPFIVSSIEAGGSTKSYDGVRGSGSGSDSLAAAMRSAFGDDVAFVVTTTGTASNALSMLLATSYHGAVRRGAAPRDASAALDDPMPLHGILLADTAHMRDAASASVARLASPVHWWPVQRPKVTARDIVTAAGRNSDPVHEAGLAVVSVSQPTEIGLVYSRAELRDLRQAADEAGILLHVDGARLSNAAAALDCSLLEATGHADLISLGGTKNGLPMGEAVVLPRGVPDSLCLGRIAKSIGQLPSKSRYLTEPYAAYLTDDRWRHLAAASNAAADTLADQLSRRPYASLAHRGDTNSNAVFVHLPRAAAEHVIATSFVFYEWPDDTGVSTADPSLALYRLMTSPETTVDEVTSLLDALDAAVNEQVH